ncbi:MAG: L-lysine 6-transaminase [Myxococcota bacterium]
MTLSAASVHETLGKWLLADGMSVVFDGEKSHGHYLHDAKSGKDYLDFFGFFAARALSFNHPRLREPDFVERMSVAATHKQSNCDLYSSDYANFVETFATKALGGHFKRVFFIEGGAPAIENALKTAFDWKVRKNLAAGRGEKGKQILHFRQAFHGRTGYALSITDSYDPRKTMYFPLWPWPRVSNPKMRFPFDEAAKAETIAAETQALKEIDEAFDKNPHDIAAIIIEPIQSEGGDNYFRSEFLRTLRKICDDRECMLIFDEIQTGMGVTGAWWDWQNHDVKPDLMTFGKKTQVCGFAATARVDEVDSVFKVASRISSTFEGNIVDMVRCQRIVDVIDSDGLVDNARTMGKYQHKLLAELAGNFSEISNVRSRGLLAAFDLPSTQERDKVVRGAFDEMLLILPCGTKSVRMRPALDVGADAIARCIAQLEAGVRRAYGREA